MKLICTTCNRIIESTNINIATDLAKCGHCGALHKASILASMVDDKYLANPPRRSKIKLTKEVEGADLIFFPKKSITASDISMIIFCLFWLGFIAFWTWCALQSSIFFALFSIPFWLIGFTMPIRIIDNINETQTIKVDKSRLTLIKSRPIIPDTYEYSFDEIVSIKMVPIKPKSIFSPSITRNMWRYQWTYSMNVMMPAIVNGLGTQYFFEGANDAEQEWVIKFLENKIKQAQK